MLRHQEAYPIADGELRLAKALLALESLIRTADGDVDLAISAVLDGALRMVPAADGALIATAGTSGLICRAARGTLADLSGKHLRNITPSAAQALAEGRFIYRSDIKDNDRFAPTVRASGARSMAAVPIPFRSGHVGALTITARQPDAFPEDQQLAIQLLAGPLALAFLGSAHLQASAGHESADRRFVATFEQAAVGMAHVAPDGSFMRVNQRFCEIAGYTEQELLDGGFQQITHPDDLAIDEHRVGELLEGAIERYQLEKRYIRQNGEIVWVNLTVSLVHTRDGAPEFFVAVIEDINPRKLAEEAARHDSLTGLLNRRGLIEELEQMLAQTDPFVLAFLDMNGFKNINDCHGHDEGDRCLVAIAESLSQVMRRRDRLARIGGDEFVIVLPREDESSAASLLGRARSSVALLARQRGWPLSFSVGAVPVPGGSGRSATEIIAAADRLMYDAKRQGEDQTVIKPLA